MNPEFRIRGARVTEVHRRHGGFTLIELMIVVAVIILILAVPVFNYYSVRAKLGEALSVATAAKNAVVTTCQEDGTLKALTNSKIGYSFSPSSWVESIEASGDCIQPVITIATRDTGAPGDPLITLTGTPGASQGAITWLCQATIENQNHYLLASCRN